MKIKLWHSADQAKSGHNYSKLPVLRSARAAAAKKTNDTQSLDETMKEAARGGANAYSFSKRFVTQE